MKKSTQQKVKIQSVSKSNIYQSNEAKQKQNKGKFSPEDLIKNRKQRKFIVKQSMKENAYLSSRKQVKHTRGEYREAQRYYRSQVEKHNQLKKSLQAADLKELGSEDSQQVRSETFSRAKLEEETDRAAEARDAVKDNLKAKRDVYKKQRKQIQQELQNRSKGKSLQLQNEKGKKHLARRAH